jgi:glycosyltransferase involved in cell wall biosynthesis
MKTAVVYDKWLAGLGGGEVVACSIAQLLRSHGYDVTLLSANSVSIEKIQQKLSINLSGITLQIGQPSSTTHPDLFINISFMDYSYGMGKRNIYYVHFPSRIRSRVFSYVLHFFKRTKLHIIFPKKLKEKVEDRLRAGIYPDMRKRLDSYDTFICHSGFVQKWIKQLWHKDAVVLYPPVHMIDSSQATHKNKKNWIVSVGRFFTLGHGKKQEVLIETFIKMFDSGINDWELHLVGGVGKEPSSVRYVENLQKIAHGYPIFFHMNVKREEVEHILLQSKIYWHAGGFGETNPINFEHFGIAPVEAISAGCSQIIFDGGGLSEIIDRLYPKNKNDYLFTTIDELISKTNKHITNDTYSAPPQALFDQFSKATFDSKFFELLHEK